METEGPIEWQGGLTKLDFAAVGLYLLLTFGISLWFSRKQKTTEDYFVGGRRMPWFAVGLSILATLFSTNSYIGTPGEVVSNGIGIFYGYMAVPINFCVIMFLWVPFFMRLRLTSAYEYLEHRFSLSVRTIGGALFVLMRIGWMGMVIFVASKSLTAIIGYDLQSLPGEDLFWFITIIGLVATVYTVLGGIEAVIWVDVLQCVLLFVGLFMVMGRIMWEDHTTWIDWWRDAKSVSERHTAPIVFSTDVTLHLTVVTIMISNFFWGCCTHGSDQVVLQRYFSTTSLAAARKSYLINLIVETTMQVCLVSTAFALLSFYGRHPSLLPDGKNSAVDMKDTLLPYFFGHQLPWGCAGLILSAFMCDAIQTLEAGVNAACAVITTEWQRRTSGRSTDAPITSLLAARCLTVLLCLTVTSVALGVGVWQQTTGMTLIPMMPKFFNLFLGPLASLFFIGMFMPRCTTRSAWIAVSCSLAAAILWSWSDVLFPKHSRLAIAMVLATPIITLLTAMLICRRFTIGRSVGLIFSASIVGAGVGVFDNWGGRFSPTNGKLTFTLAVALPVLTAMASAMMSCLLLEDSKDHPGRSFTWRAIMRRPVPKIGTDATTEP